MELLKRALIAAKSLLYEEKRCKAMAIVAAKLPPSKQHQSVFQQVLEAAQRIKPEHL
jgi:hypothetical protein